MCACQRGKGMGIGEGRKREREKEGASLLTSFSPLPYQPLVLAMTDDEELPISLSQEGWGTCLLHNVGKADSCTSVGNQLRARRRRCVEGCRQSGTTITTTAATFGRRCTVPDLLTSLRRQYGFASSQSSTTRIGGQGGVDSEGEREREGKERHVQMQQLGLRTHTRVKGESWRMGGEPYTT
ncbi:hypothetical protein C0Q70_00686 [Pomacea canaliculata]|uniref:Uncharacterized protein n=1 Tax=Pomacea canaliculata TaxID=400727 RepID=A0A2T7PXC2_POMCA|nr:hypothetical protein C0Q70_00686 [Pomacea canaliculata]